MIRYFIIDTSGKGDFNNHDDEDFIKYSWDEARFGKVRKGDKFIYRRPQKNSNISEFYFFGAGTFGKINNVSIDNKKVYSFLENCIEFENIIPQSNEEIKAYNWEFKNRNIDNWLHFFNQYGMTEITKNDFDFLLKLAEVDDLKSKINLDISVKNEIETVYIEKEGKRRLVYSYKYERNPKLRKAALDIHGYSCKACGFNFEEKYGEIGKNFIEVHHKEPLYTLKEESNINPNIDLVPLCSNCHRMIHRKKNQILSVEELIDIIK